MKIFRCFIIITTVVLLLSGCAAPDRPGPDETPPSYEYTEVYQRVSELCGGNFILNGNVYQTIVGGHTYEFERTVSAEARSAFVTNQEELCRLLEQNGLSTGGLTFRILADYSNRTESENRLAYYGLNSMKTWEQVLTAIQVCEGDDTNYGYLYALAGLVTAELKWTCDDAHAGNEKVFVEDPALLNLVYPCFSEKYSDAESVAACKALSVKLLSEVGNIWSEDEFLRAREAYAQEQGIAFQPTYLTFSYGGVSCPLILRCRYLEVFWDSTFVANNEYLDGLLSEDYTEDIDGLIHTFEWLDEQLLARCNRVGAAPDGRVSVQMTEVIPHGSYFKAGGIYHNSGGQIRIYATTVTALAHEYMHHLHWLLSGEDNSVGSWYSEVFAYYYTVERNYEYLTNSMRVNPALYQKMETMLGEAWDEPSDYFKQLQIACRADQKLDPVYYLKSGDGIGAIFGEFFVRTYGEEAFLNAMVHPSRIKEFTGHSMDEVISEWLADLRNSGNAAPDLDVP